MAHDADRRVVMLAVLLAACSGSADVFAFAGLGKAFASIVTGNFVVFGYGVATGNTALITPTAAALAGFVAGAVTWSLLLRRPKARRSLLVGELVILLTVLAAWLAVGAHPNGVLKPVLLALTSAAFGGQSVWALRVRQTTTYFTGTLTDAVNAAVSGSTDRLRTALRQFASLVTGAILCGVVLSQLRLAAPALSVLLLAMAILVDWRIAATHVER
jgi:uncharacterized membrane protein YoaK (UPF0700 family)